MKKISLFLLSALFIFNMAQAQEQSLVKSIQLLETASATQFKDIQGAEIAKQMKNEDVLTIYDSKLKVEKALSNTVIAKTSTKRNTATFEALLGEFQTLAEAERFLTTVVSDFNKNNNEGYIARKIDRYMVEYPAYVVLNLTSISITLFSNASFEINEEKDKFYVSFYYGSDIPKQDYIAITKEKSYNKIDNELRAMLQEAKNNFAVYKGKEMKNAKTTLGTFDKQYESIVNVGGVAAPCFLIERLSVLEMVVPFKKGIKNNNINEELKNTMAFMESLLGIGYAYSITPLWGSVSYVVINDYDYFNRFIKVAEIQISDAGNSTSDIYIILKPYNKLVNY